MSKALVGAAVIVCAFVVLTLTLAVVQQEPPTADSDADVPARDASDTTELPQTLPPAPSMTRDQFEQIRNAMTYAECMTVIGVEGTPVASAQCQAKGIEYAYAWHDPNGKTLYEVGFRGGRVVARGFGAAPAHEQRMAERLEAQRKATAVIQEPEALRLEQAAIRSGRSPVVTVAELAQIHPGMTYDECVALIGAGNPMADQYAAPRNRALGSSPDVKATLEESYGWPNPGGYHAEITFRNGRVTTKCWKKGPAGSGGSISGSSRK